MRKFGRLVSLLTVAMTSAVLLGGCTANISQHSFYSPDMRKVSPEAKFRPPEGYGLSDEILELEGLGKLHVVRLDNPNSEDTLIYSGGNGHLIAEQSQRAAALADATGMDIILYDYPGRGGTTITSTVDNSLATYPAMMTALKDKGWLGNGKLYAYGLSFGGSQTAAMVRDGGFDGVIIEGSAPDYARIGRDFVPPLLRPFVSLKLDPELQRFAFYDYARSAGAPVLLLSSDGDKIIRPTRMKEFYDRLKADGADVKLVSLPGGHGSALMVPGGRAALAKFVGNTASN